MTLKKRLRGNPLSPVFSSFACACTQHRRAALDHWTARYASAMVTEAAMSPGLQPRELAHAYGEQLVLKKEIGR